MASESSTFADLNLIDAFIDGIRNRVDKINEVDWQAEGKKIGLADGEIAPLTQEIESKYDSVDHELKVRRDSQERYLTDSVRRHDEAAKASGNPIKAQIESISQDLDPTNPRSLIAIQETIIEESQTKLAALEPQVTVKTDDQVAAEARKQEHAAFRQQFDKEMQEKALDLAKELGNRAHTIAQQRSMIAQQLGDLAKSQAKPDEMTEKIAALKELDESLFEMQKQIPKDRKLIKGLDKVANSVRDNISTWVKDNPGPEMLYSWRNNVVQYRRFLFFAFLIIILAEQLVMSQYTFKALDVDSLQQLAVAIIHPGRAAAIKDPSSIQSLANLDATGSSANTGSDPNEPEPTEYHDLFTKIIVGLVGASRLAAGIFFGCFPLVLSCMGKLYLDVHGSDPRKMRHYRNVSLFAVLVYLVALASVYIFQVPEGANAALLPLYRLPIAGCAFGISSVLILLGGWVLHLRYRLLAHSNLKKKLDDEIAQLKAQIEHAREAIKARRSQLAAKQEELANLATDPASAQSLRSAFSVAIDQLSEMVEKAKVAAVSAANVGYGTGLRMRDTGVDVEEEKSNETPEALITRIKRTRLREDLYKGGKPLAYSTNA